MKIGQLIKLVIFLKNYTQNVVEKLQSLTKSLEQNGVIQ